MTLFPIIFPLHFWTIKCLDMSTQNVFKTSDTPRMNNTGVHKTIDTNPFKIPYVPEEITIGLSASITFQV